MLGICHFWVMEYCESTHRMAFLSAERCIKEELPGADRKASAAVNLSDRGSQRGCPKVVAEVEP
jgi:hypothetical protein